MYISQIQFFLGLVVDRPSTVSYFLFTIRLLSDGKERSGPSLGVFIFWKREDSKVRMRRRLEGRRERPTSGARTHTEEKRKLHMLRNGKMMKMSRDFFLYFMTSRIQCPCTGSRSRGVREKVSVRTEHKPPTSQKAAGTDRVAS